MPIRPLRSADLPALRALYDAVTAPFAHGFLPTEEEFAAAFTGKPANLRDSVTLVAERGGAPVGFARAGLYRPVPDLWALAEEGQGALFGPFVGQEHRAEGAALIAAAMRHLKTRKAAVTYAFDQGEAASAPFHNGGWIGLSDRLPHLVALLLEAGFRIKGRELCLTRPALPLPPAEAPPKPFHLLFEKRDHNRFTVRVHDGETPAGACYYSLMFPRRSRRPEAEQWGYVDGIGVPEEYQGRGLGRLLMEHALQRLRAIGVGPVCLTTGHANFRAQNLYFSMGFELVDSALTFVHSEENV